MFNMKIILRFIPLFLLHILLSSASFTTNQPGENSSKPEIMVSTPGAQTTTQKLNFFHKLLFKLSGKHAYSNQVNADRQAKNALTYGIVAASTLVVGLLVPYVILFSVPFSILAIAKGSKALKNGTALSSKASTGKTLGLVSLILFGVILALAIAVVSSLNW